MEKAAEGAAVTTSCATTSPGDIIPHVDSWGQWQGLTALPATAGVTGKCVCVPPALPGD